MDQAPPIYVYFLFLNYMHIITQIKDGKFKEKDKDELSNVYK